MVASEKRADEDISGHATSEISLEFCDSVTGNLLGQSIVLEATNLSVSNIENVPDYKKQEIELEGKEGTFSRWLIGRENKDYYREYVEYVIKSALFKPIAFALKNNGVIGARDIFIDMRITTDISEITVGTNVELNLKEPTTQRDSAISISLGEAFSAVGGETLSVTTSSDVWNANFETRALQPKRIVKSKHTMVIGANSTGSVDIEAKIYADILPEPLVQHLHIKMQIEQVDVSALDLLIKNEILAEAKGTTKTIRRRRQN